MIFGYSNVITILIEHLHTNIRIGCKNVSLFLLQRPLLLIILNMRNRIRSLFYHHLHLPQPRKHHFDLILHISPSQVPKKSHIHEILISDSIFTRNDFSSIHQHMWMLSFELEISGNNDRNQSAQIVYISEIVKFSLNSRQKEQFSLRGNLHFESLSELPLYLLLLLLTSVLI